MSQLSVWKIRQIVSINSINFAKLIQNFASTNHIIVTFHVKPLFAKVHVIQALYCPEKIPRFSFYIFQIISYYLLFAHISHMTASNCFFFQGNFYKQSEDASIRLSLSLVLENMHYFEGILFNKCSFTFKIRYFDDTFTLIDTSLLNIDVTLNIMN